MGGGLGDSGEETAAATACVRRPLTVPPGAEDKALAEPARLSTYLRPRLRGLGFDAPLIAAELGVSMRHVRRLLRKDLVGPIAGAAHGWAQLEARRLVSDLRTELKAEGFRFHQWVMRGDRLAGAPTHPDRPRPVFKVKALMREEKFALLRSGLSADQMWAIGVAGLGADELNEFLMRGLR